MNVNSVLNKLIEDTTNKFNKNTMVGVATEKLEEAPEYLDEIIKSTMAAAPEGLEYKGYVILTPEEEIRSTFGNNSDKRFDYDLARSDIYKIKLLFTFNGEELPPRYLYLPFASRGGVLTLSGTKYNVLPILSDTVVSPGYTKIFVRLVRDKLNFEQFNYNILENSKKISGQIIYSEIYRIKTPIRDNIGRVKPPTACYLFSKHGIRKTFEKYCDSKIKIFVGDPDEETIANYTIYESLKSKPRSLKRLDRYFPNELKVAIEKNKKTSLTTALATGLIYLFDVFPDRLEEFLEAYEEGILSKEIEYMRYLLGVIIFKDNYSPYRISVDIRDHFQGLETYIPKIIKDKLEETDIVIKDFFDLQAVIMERYNVWLLSSKQMSNNFFNRYIDILYYILFDIIISINKCIYEITRKNNKSPCTYAEISKIMNENITPKKIHNIVKTSGMNISLQLLDVVGDNIVPRVSSMLELQESGDGVKKNNKNGLPPNIRTSIAGFFLVGSVYGLKKSRPTPLATLNPFLETTPTGTTKVPKDLKSQLTNLDILLSLSEIKN